MKLTARSDRKRQSDFFDICSHCKTNYSCCNDTTPPVTDDRRKIIESFLEKSRIMINEPFVKTDYTFPRLKLSEFCIFHDERTRKCLIHVVKPETCVAGPITFDINLKNQSIEWYAKKEEICQLAGVVCSDKPLLRKHLQTAKKEILRLVSELDSQALNAILRKAEPETFKIDEDKIGQDVLRKLN